MTSVKISALTAAGTLVGTETVPVVQNGVTVRAQVNDLLTYANINISQTVATLAALKALTTRPEAVIVETGQAAGVWQWALASTTTADDALVVTPTSGTAGRYKRIYQPGVVWAEWFGALGDDSTDNATAIAAAITALGPYSAGTVQDGGLLLFGAGIFRVGSTITMTEKHGLTIQGAGPLATEVKGTGDFAVFTMIGATSSNVTNKAGIRSLSVRGPGKANTSAHGISTKWTNRCFVEDVTVFACRHGLNLYHSWQLKLDNVQPHGGGADQNYNGFYLGESTLTDIDNAVIATGCTTQQCENAGFRIINGQGSKFTSCEAGSSAYGWYVGDPTTGTVKSQWIHFDNCLGDTCTTQNWFFKLGSATALGEMIMTGTWSGNSSGAGIQLESVTDFNITGLIAITLQTEAVKIVSGTRVTVSNVTARQYNNANGGTACIKLEDSSNCMISGINEFSTNARSVVTETGTADTNVLSGLSGQPTTVGDSTVFVGAIGTYGYQHKRTGDAAIAVIGGASNTAYLGLGTEANPLTTNINRGTTGRIATHTGGSQRMYVGNGVGATEFLVGFDVPVLLPVSTVANLPTGTTGTLAYASNGRKNGEGAGVGTGVLVFKDGTAWRACDTGATVAA